MASRTSSSCGAGGTIAPLQSSTSTHPRAMLIDKSKRSMTRSANCCRLSSGCTRNSLHHEGAGPTLGQELAEACDVFDAWDVVEQHVRVDVAGGPGGAEPRDEL